MASYVRKRLIGLVFVLIGITVFSFIIANISPIDPAEAYVRRNTKIASEEQIDQMRKEMGLDLPIYKQYFIWVSKILKFDFGKSLTTGNDVLKDIGRVLPCTLKLVGVAMLIVAVVIIPLSVLCVVYKNTMLDSLIRLITLLGVSIPSFWFGFVLLYFFAVKLKMVPVVGYGEFKNILLPAVTLSIPIISSNIRILRANMLENINKEYITYAKARGISNKKILFKHVLINAISPMITIFGQTIGYTIAGTTIVENVFTWPGIGNYIVKVIIARDLPVVNAYILIMAVIFVTCNLAADLINILINPKILKENGDV